VKVIWLEFHYGTILFGTGNILLHSHGRDRGLEIEKTGIDGRSERQESPEVRPDGEKGQVEGPCVTMHQQCKSETAAAVSSMHQ
jgi:hypothetical protein